MQVNLLNSIPYKPTQIILYCSVFTSRLLRFNLLLSEALKDSIIKELGQNPISFSGLKKHKLLAHVSLRNDDIFDFVAISQR